MPRPCRFPLAALAIAVLAACGDADVVTGAFATLAEARAEGAIAKGYVPDGLPPGTREIREAHDLESPRRWGLFNFPPAEADALKTLLGAELPASGVRVDPPRRIEWWPVLIRGALDGEQLLATGTRLYPARQGTLIFAVNWAQGRAYYWTRESER